MVIPHIDGKMGIRAAFLYIYKRVSIAERTTQLPQQHVSGSLAHCPAFGRGSLQVTNNRVQS